MGIIIEKAGFLTSIQDGGRYGKQQYGVTVSGALDIRSLSVANLLVGNDKDAAALEATMVGPHIRFTEDSIFAITGADMSPCLNGIPVEMSRATAAKTGDLLCLSSVKYGCRSYIAFAGGIDVPDVMGSKSTFLRGKFGGLEGRSLQKEDKISFLTPQSELTDLSFRKRTPEIFSNKEITLRVIRGPQDYAFTEKGMDTFLTMPYTITKECDRMGVRLDGVIIEHIVDGGQKGNIVSEGIAFGSIQIPPNGLPIIMLAERQITGGYTKIATVISVDLPLIAQAKPGMKINFQEVGIQEAQDLYMQQYRMLTELTDSFRGSVIMQSEWSVQDIKELMAAMKENHISEIRIDGAKLEIYTGDTSAKIISTVNPAEKLTLTDVDSADGKKQDGEKLVVSPIIGTFYKAPAPDQQPFVTVGSKVKQGDVLGIIESMKLMNEVICETEGVIAEVLVHNEQNVEYGQPLFRFE